MQIEARAERAFAVPIDRLWPSVTAVHRYLDAVAEIVAYETDSADRTAVFDARLKVGPVVWNVAGSSAVAVVAPGHEVSIRLSAPKLVLRYDGALALHDAGANAGRVRYHGVITCEHRLIGTLHFLLRQIVTEHVDGFLDEVVGQAESAYRAEQALLGRARRDRP